MTRRLPIRPVAAAIAVLVLLAAPAFANSSAFLIVDNLATGDPIVGQAIAPDGFRDITEVYEFHHLVVRQFDPSGVGGSSSWDIPEHRPLVVTVPMGFEMTQLFEAFSNGSFLRVRLRTYWQNQAAHEFDLDDALLVAIEPVTLNENGVDREMLKLRFVYRTWKVTDLAANQSSQWQLQSWPN